MANGFEAVIKRKESSAGVVGKLGSRRIFAPQFKLQVLESYRRDADCRGNQRATARKYGIHRRQIQKWLQAEQSLRAGLARRAAAAKPVETETAQPESRLCEGPVDLSVDRRRCPEPPSPPSSSWSGGDLVLASQASPSYPSSSCEAWDLSWQPPPPQPKPVKLFRPYLLDEDEERRPSAFDVVRPRESTPPRFFPVDYEQPDAYFHTEYRVHKWLRDSAILQRAHTAG